MGSVTVECIEVEEGVDGRDEERENYVGRCSAGVDLQNCLSTKDCFIGGARTAMGEGGRGDTMRQLCVPGMSHHREG